MLSRVQATLKKSILILPLLTFFACESEKQATNAANEKEQLPLFKMHPYDSTGITFMNKIVDRPLMNVVLYEYYHNGAGVGAGDFNNDGLTDLYFVGNFGKNRLYLNKGNFRFTDVTESSNSAGDFGWSTGVCLVDINNDGWLDIYLSKSGDLEFEQRKNELLINQGNMTFKNEAEAYGLADAGYSTQASFFDYDLDGDLDAYVMNHPVNPRQDLDFYKLKETSDRFASDHLYENRDGKFVDVSKKAGLWNNSIGFGLGLSVFDMNGDRFPDIYICNDYLEKDYLYRNNGDGTFSDILSTATGHTSNFSMGNDAADFNNDGLIDIYVADMAAEDNYRSKTNMSGMAPDRFWRAVDAGFHYQYMINTLQLNNGNETFSEISQLAGIDKTDWSWSPLFADFDNDGFKDLMITNGLRKEMRNNDFVKRKKEILKDMEGKSQQERMNMLKQIIDIMPQQKISNYIFRNNGDLTFTIMNKAWNFEKPSFSNGASYADLDNDGDLDVIINNIDDPIFLYENQSEGNNYLQMRLNGPVNNKQGIGSRLEISIGDKLQVAEMYPSRGYLSTVEDRVHFGIGEASGIDELRIIWPDGKMQRIRNPEINTIHSLDYSNASEEQSTQGQIKYQFEEVTSQLLGTVPHKESAYDDYKKQILLPHKMSELGPALAISDVNKDGREDFYLGGSNGSIGKLFIQTENGFQLSANSAFKSDSRFEDIDAIFFDFEGDGDQDLLVVSGGNESGVQSEDYRDRLYLNDGNGDFTKSENALPDYNFSGGVVIGADIDNDGDEDLFIGGRQIPEHYPSPAPSVILRNTGNRFELANDWMPSWFDSLGMVTDAEFTDYNEDGLLDLMVVGEWMPITILQQTSNGFTDRIELENSKGWWNCIRAADLNGDGREDYILGNLGLNIRYKGNDAEPFKVYASDFDENGLFDIVLSSTKGVENFPVRGRQCSSEQLPEITERFPTYDLFAKATIEEIYTKEELSNAIYYEADNFSSSVLMNNGKSQWNLQSLPNEAQISAVEAAIAQDLDKDGYIDILLAGNMLETEVETPRCDASRGIFLKGSENGFEGKLSQADLKMDGNIRQLEEISINGVPYFILVRSDGPVSFLRMSNDNP